MIQIFQQRYYIQSMVKDFKCTPQNIQKQFFGRFNVLVPKVFKIKNEKTQLYSPIFSSFIRKLVLFSYTSSNLMRQLFTRCFNTYAKLNCIEAVPLNFLLQQNHNIILGLCWLKLNCYSTVLNGYELNFGCLEAIHVEMPQILKRH